MKSAKKVLVVGLGRFGSAIVETLWDRGVDVIVVDRDADAIDDLKSKTQASFVADGTDPRVLEGVGAREVDAAVVTFGEAFESAVLTVATLKGFGLPEIVARAATSRRADVLRAVGATRVLQLEQEMGERVASELVTPSARDLLDLAALYRVVPWVAAGALVGRDLKSSGIRQRYGINVIGVRRTGEASAAVRLQAPSPDHVIGEGDILLLVGEDASVRRFVSDFEGG